MSNYPDGAEFDPQAPYNHWDEDEEEEEINFEQYEEAEEIPEERDIEEYETLQ